MSEVSEPKVELTPEQQVILDKIEASIPDACDGCSTAEFTALRIALAATTPRRVGGVEGVIGLSRNGVQELIERQRNCPGRCPISGYCQLGRVPED